MHTSALSRIMIVGFIFAVSLGATKSQAAGFVVTKASDSNDGVCNADCSLREAIIAANANPGSDLITLPANIYVLTIAGQQEEFSASGDLDVRDQVTISGAGAGITAINGNNIDRVLQIHPNVTATITDLTIMSGKTADSQSGGGILNQGTLSLTNAAINGNTSYASSCTNSKGGGIANEAILSMTNSSVLGNNATWGGGIANTGSITVTASLIQGNSSSNGGGIRNGFGAPSTAVVIGSDIRQNSATTPCQVGPGIFIADFGGGVFNSSKLVMTDSSVTDNDDSAGSVFQYPAGSQAIILRSTISLGNSQGIINQAALMTINNSTISSNGKEGIQNTSSGQIKIASSTITNNGGTNGGILNQSGVVQLQNTLVAKNTGSSTKDVSGAFTSNGFNLIGIKDGSTGFTNGVNGDIVGTAASPQNPQLGSLQNNGGLTTTHALLTGSPAINKGNTSGCVDTEGIPQASDQRGYMRTINGICDIGAYEYGYAELFLPIIVR